MDFVVVDMEKLNDDQCSVCEVGMVKCNDLGIVADFHSLIKPRIGLERNGFGKTKLAKITDDMILAAPDFIDVYSKMKEFSKGCVLVCYSKAADLNYLYYKEKECGVSGLYTEYVDVYEMTNKSLGNAYKYAFGREMQNHHSALEDARHTAELFIKLLPSVDISQYVKHDYIPEKERPKSNSFQFQNTNIDGLILEDGLLDDFDFKGQTCVVSGESQYRKAIETELPGLCKRLAKSLSGKTDVFIVGNTVGSSKKKQALELKQNRPDAFHIFTQKAVAHKLGIF